MTRYRLKSGSSSSPNSLPLVFDGLENRPPLAGDADFGKSDVESGLPKRSWRLSAEGARGVVGAGAGASAGAAANGAAPSPLVCCARPSASIGGPVGIGPCTSSYERSGAGCASSSGGDGGSSGSAGGGEIAGDGFRSLQTLNFRAFNRNFWMA